MYTMYVSLHSTAYARMQLNPAPSNFNIQFLPLRDKIGISVPQRNLNGVGLFFVATFIFPHEQLK